MNVADILTQCDYHGNKFFSHVSMSWNYWKHVRWDPQNSAYWTTNIIYDLFFHHCNAYSRDTITAISRHFPCNQSCMGWDPRHEIHQNPTTSCTKSQQWTQSNDDKWFSFQVFVIFPADSVSYWQYSTWQNRSEMHAEPTSGHYGPSNGRDSNGEIILSGLFRCESGDVPL